MSNLKSNKNGWMDDDFGCNHHKKEDCCCKNHKNGWIDDDFEYDHHEKEDCCCKDHKKVDKYEKEDKHEKEDCCCKDHKKVDKYEKEDCYCKDHKKEHKHEKEECCCKESMRRALELLLNDELRKCVEFDEFVFIGHRFLVGANIREDLAGNDNINNPNNFGAQFNGFESCNCDLIKLSAEDVFYPIPDNTPTSGSSQVTIPDFPNIRYASLCDIEAVVFNYDCNQEHFEEDLAKCLDEFNKKCKVNCDKCCCNEGIFNKFFNPCNPNNTISLTASWLAVKDAKILGKIGTVLVLSSTVTKRIYFVCLDSIGFVGN